MIQLQQRDAVRDPAQRRGKGIGRRGHLTSGRRRAPGACRGAAGSQLVAQQRFSQCRRQIYEGHLAGQTGNQIPSGREADTAGRGRPGRQPGQQRIAERQPDGGIARGADGQHSATILGPAPIFDTSGGGGQPGRRELPPHCFCQVRCLRHRGGQGEHRGSRPRRWSSRWRRRRAPLLDGGKAGISTARTGSATRSSSERPMRARSPTYNDATRAARLPHCETASASGIRLRRMRRAASVGISTSGLSSATASASGTGRRTRSNGATLRISTNPPIRAGRHVVGMSGPGRDLLGGQRAGQQLLRRQRVAGQTVDRPQGCRGAGGGAAEPGGQGHPCAGSGPRRTVRRAAPAACGRPPPRCCCRRAAGGRNRR